MNSHQLEATLAAAYPVDRERLERLDLEALEADLLADVDGVDRPAAASRRRPRRRPLGLGLGLAGVALAALVVAVVVLLAGGGAERPSPAYGAELIRYAERTPLLLLEGPGWGVRDVDQFDAATGTIQFTKASPEPHPDEALETRAETKRHETPPAVIARALRYMELAWHEGAARAAPGQGLRAKIPALGVTATIYPRTERSWRQGGPGHRAMLAVWQEGGRTIELRATVPSLAAFRERLGWLRRVGAEEWLEAMPPRVVKTADHAATVEAMLAGIPLPPGFDATALKREDLTADRYQVGARVGGAVACGWFQTWGKALGAGDTATVEEAESVLGEAADTWPIFREMAKEGAYPATVTEYAEAMSSRRWYGKPLLPAVEQGLGCASR
ncbi:MAG: hypothetical protein QM729_19190 [Solirubrobacterales bacterium]